MDEDALPYKFVQDPSITKLEISGLPLCTEEEYLDILLASGTFMSSLNDGSLGRHYQRADLTNDLNEAQLLVVRLVMHCVANKLCCFVVGGAGSGKLEVSKNIDD